MSSTFDDLGLPADLLQAVTDLGFTTPTEIQAAAIPPLLAGHDVVGVAQTGTGKTAAFGLPLLANIEVKGGVQALVLAPTRELALQSASAISDFAARSRQVNVVAVYGGSAYGPQLRALKEGAQVVVGTPGRIMDLAERGALDLSGVRFFVLDEADEMLRMGFAEDVETISALLPEGGIKALFSATMPPAISKVAGRHLVDPVEISVTPQASTVDTVHQTYAVVPFKHKMGALGRVLATRDSQGAIVFVRTRQDAEEVATDLVGRGFKAAALSGDVAQLERERIIERLRTGVLDVLVATDVAARGLDVERIGMVINYDVPRETEAYVHRIGRTGRAGRQGVALTFFTPRESMRLRKIEKLTGTKLEEVTLPTPKDVSQHRATCALSEISARIERGRLELYFDLIEKTCREGGHDLADIAAVLLALQVGDNGPDPVEEKSLRGRIRREESVDENGQFLAAQFEKGRDTIAPTRAGAKRITRASSGFGHSRKYRVEVGHRDGVRAGAIVGAITNEGGIPGSDLGRIEIFPSFSLVEINGSLPSEATRRISKARVAGRALRIREDSGPRGKSSRHFDGPKRRKMN